MPICISQATKEGLLKGQEQIPDLRYEFELSPEEAKKFFFEFLPRPDDFNKEEFDKMFNLNIKVKYTLDFFKTEDHDKVLDNIVERKKLEQEDIGVD